MAAPYEKGYFFDNEERRIVEVSAYCPDITCNKFCPTIYDYDNNLLYRQNRV